MLIICGKSASGKTHIQKELNRICGMKRIITYTTRPIRPGEQNGVEYHFISKEDFLKKIEEGFFAESVCYRVAEDQLWYYGTSIESLQNADEDSVIICNPSGLRYIKRQKDIDSTVFYIHTNEDVIRERLLQRGDDPQEADRRLDADRDDFITIEDYYNYAIENNGRKSPTIIAEEIWLAYKTEKKLLEDLNDR